MSRPTLSLARAHAQRPLDVARLDGESDRHYEARAASIRALGQRWLRHPEYQFVPLHSTNAEVWMPAHRVFWQQVHVAAAADRARNAAARRTEAVRAALGAA